jgi:biotin transport system substrate-specific component
MENFSVLILKHDIYNVFKLIGKENYLMSKTQRLTLIALAAALMAVISPFSIPIGPIPLSLATLVLYILGTVLGPLESLCAIIVYLGLGMMGLPVFSNFGSGVAKIIGPTGGFLIGYIPCILIQSTMITFLKKRWIYPVAMFLGTIVLYAMGLGWFLIMMNGKKTFIDALMLCVVPFLAGDSIKIVIATIVGYVLRPLADKQLYTKARRQ